MRYPFIYEQSRDYSVSLLTKVMQVDRRSYYRWLAMQANKLKISPSQVKRNRDKASVKHLFEAEKAK